MWDWILPAIRVMCTLCTTISLIPSISARIIRLSRMEKSTDIAAECERYDKQIASLGGIDLQLLGIGRNGHIGFNEPDRVFTKGTHCVSLAESTIEANKRFFDSIDDVPRQALTMGICDIIQAKKSCAGGIRRGQSGCGSESFLRTGNTGSTCIDPAVTSELHTGGR